MIRLIITILILTVLKKVINAQEIVTDRPDQTESSTTVPNKSFQMEMGCGSGDYNSDRLSLLPTALFRYGLSKSIELRFVEQLAAFNNKATSETQFGLSDIEFGLKIQVLKKEDINTEIAFISHLIIPTGSSELTNTNYGTINKLAISHGLNKFLDMGLSDKMGMYVETFGEYSDFAELTSNFDSGLTYLIKDNLQ
jgi:hypothetical protein